MKKKSLIFIMALSFVCFMFVGCNNTNQNNNYNNTGNSANSKTESQTNEPQDNILLDIIEDYNITKLSVDYSGSSGNSNYYIIEMFNIKLYTTTELDSLENLIYKETTNILLDSSYSLIEKNINGVKAQAKNNIMCGIIIIKVIDTDTSNVLIDYKNRSISFIVNKELNIATCILTLGSKVGDLVITLKL